MNKIKKLQIFRFIIQILLLMLLPGLFIMAFSGLKEIIGMLLAGNFNFVQAMPSLVEIIVVTAFTLLLGRMFCGWMCAFGAYNDFVYLISAKLPGKRLKVNEKADSVLKSLKYIILFTIILTSCVLGSTILSSISPWDAFSQLPDFKGILTAVPIGLLLLLFITIGAFFIERFFCRYLCPLGAFFTLTSKLSLFKVNKPAEKCGSCRICTDNCSMGLKLYKTESVHGGECINCLKCIEACPRKNTCVNVFGQDVNSTTASTVAIAAFTVIYGINSLGGYIADQNNLVSTGYSVSSTINAQTQKYKDGTYTGSGTGFRRGTTEIELTIENGKITSISTLSSQDTPRFYNRVFDTEVDRIISSQSADIDTISGATFSCRGIISAVEDALSKAENNTSAFDFTSDSSTEVNSNTSDSSTEVTSNSSTAENNCVSETAESETIGSTEAETQNGKYNDGTYTGTGTGFRGGTTEISVTISGGKITEIDTLATRDTPRFYNRCAAAITGEIISTQSDSVDTVSGATYSSNGIIEAVRDALSKAA